MDDSEIKKRLEDIAQTGFETGYKVAISVLENAAKKCPENKQSFLMSAEVLRQIRDVCMKERGKSLAEAMICD